MSKYCEQPASRRPVFQSSLSAMWNRVWNEETGSVTRYFSSPLTSAFQWTVVSGATYTQAQKLSSLFLLLRQWADVPTRTVSRPICVAIDISVCVNSHRHQCLSEQTSTSLFVWTDIDISVCVNSHRHQCLSEQSSLAVQYIEQLRCWTAFYDNGQMFKPLQ